MKTTPVAVKPTLLVHQEGVVGVLAIVGLAFSEVGPGRALAPRSGLVPSLLIGAACGLALACLVWVVRRLGPLHALEEWQRELVGAWTPSEAVAIAVLSGVAEEALLRAVLQPLIGLWLAALLFAVLHVVPDRRLWMWPLLAMAMGVVFGVLFARWGYPACATAHAMVNVVGLLRLGAGGRHKALETKR